MTAKLVRNENYVAGWLNSSIHDFVETLPLEGGSTKYALITCLDSNPNVASLVEKSPELKAVKHQSEPLGAGLVLPTRLLVSTDSGKQIFFGFDEVFFFPNNDIKPKPSSLTIVGPARPDQKTLTTLGKWMFQNACSMALGDGEGLNFIVKAKGLVAYLLGHSIEQPLPANPCEIVESSWASDSMPVTAKLANGRK